MGILLDVKALVHKRRLELRQKVLFLQENYQITPKIVVIIVGENPGSQSYVKGKQTAARAIGVESEVIAYPETVSQVEILQVIQKHNADPKTHGIIVQLPLPANLDESLITSTILADKDVDGFCAEHQGRLVSGQKGFISCTPKGIIEILKMSGQTIAGKHVVVIGRSNIVGKPVALLAVAEHATVTICHSQTQNLCAITQMADILIVAIGKAEFITKEYVKSGAIVIDVGVNRASGTTKLLGDVKTTDVLEVASIVTPVPGGVGPMTITMLLENTIEAAYFQNHIAFDISY
ncbi:5,10-methylene-tetrahydrofolate dehydrogenase [Erysipelotrichaceae bacterium]|nr:5,10-methylene-tetrahydrofolate dehydrogenase [Erysipelotrichaceae bacterium]